MEDISNLRIVGIDEERPPRIRKEPYIDLFFRLSHKAPEEWCENFNKLVKELVPPVMIDKKNGIFIDAYVRHMNHITEHLDRIKQKIADCNEQFIEAMRQRELAAAAENTSLRPEEGEQRKLNNIIAALKFDD